MHAVHVGLGANKLRCLSFPSKRSGRKQCSNSSQKQRRQQPATRAVNQWILLNCWGHDAVKDDRLLLHGSPDAKLRTVRCCRATGRSTSVSNLSPSYVQRQQHVREHHPDSQISTALSASSTTPTTLSSTAYFPRRQNATCFTSTFCVSSCSLIRRSALMLSRTTSAYYYSWR